MHNANELNDLKKIYKASFPTETQKYVDYFFRYKFNGKNAITKKINGSIVSVFFVMEKYMSILGCEFFSPFITAVGTLPEHRGNGYMSELMTSGINELAKTADIVTLATDDKHGFYHKLGFSTYTFIQKKTITVAENGQPPPRLTQITSPSPQAVATLKRIYADFMKDKNGYIIRDTAATEAWLNEILADGGKVFLIEDTAYIVIENDGISELAAPKAIISRLNMFDGQVYNDFARTGAPHNMIRLLNPQSVLNKINYNTDGAVKINLVDHQIAKNNATFLLTVKGGKATTTPCDTADITINITDLTDMIFGYKNYNNLFKTPQNAIFDKY